MRGSSDTLAGLKLEEAIVGAHGGRAPGPEARARANRSESDDSQRGVWRAPSRTHSTPALAGAHTTNLCRVQQEGCH